MNSVKIALLGISMAGMLSGCGSDASGETPSNAAAVKESVEKVGEKKRIDQNSDQSEAVKAALQALIRECEQADYEAAGRHMIYRGDNADMKWKEPVNYKNEDDKPYVEKTCAKIQAILHTSKSLKFNKFFTETESEGTWLVWLVDVMYEDGSSKETAFAFLAYGKNYGLGDID